MRYARKPRTTSLLAVALAGSVSLTLAACGGGDDADTSGGGGEQADGTSPAEMTTVEVGVIPVIDVAVLYLGQEQGFFEERGITLNFNTGQGGAALVPSVVSGEYDIAFSNVISIMQAREQGLPLTIISPAAASTGDEDFGINMLMAIDPAIEDAGDLVGRTVGVNTLNNLSELMVNVSVDAAGGDPEEVRLAELPFPDQVTALVSGDIDAFVCAEPFCSTAAAEGARVIANPYHDLAPGDQIAASVYFTTEKAIEDDPELFKNLQEAISESQAFAAENPDEVKAQLPNFTQLDPTLIESLRLPEFKSSLEPEELEPMADAAVKFGIVKEDPVLDEVVWVAGD